VATGRRPQALGVLLLGAVLLAGCAGSTSGDGREQARPQAPTPTAGTASPRQLSTHNVLVVGGTDNRFHPANFVVDPGAAGRYEITFTVPSDGEAHTVESDPVPFDSGRVEPGQTRRFGFRGEPGTYDVYCRYHREQGMVGKVTLR
jgi:plastocyanin